VAEAVIGVQPSRRGARPLEAEARMGVDAASLHGREIVGYETKPMGVHVILSGTGNLSHLESNVASLGRGPLPPEDVARLREMFARVDDVSGN